MNCNIFSLLARVALAVVLLSPCTALSDCAADRTASALPSVADADSTTAASVVVGADRSDVYVPLLAGRRVALLSNHTGVTSTGEHVLDVMLARGLNVTTIFSPEHGFRGDADAGEHVGSSVDRRTGIPIASLYDGRTSRPADTTMARFDVLVVDLQDVGVRFYTYYVTMVQLMEACAAADKLVVVFDRPNPNIMVVDGPVLDMRLRSGVGRLPIPNAYGMTLGELARMVVGEHWLTGADSCRLTVVPCLHYTRHTRYRLPVPPSPNLPDMKAVYLYPSTCYFEGTPVSLGRGTDYPFQVYGHPQMKGHNGFTFTPRSRAGAKKPPCQDQLCHGVDLRGVSDDDAIGQGVNLNYIIDAYHDLNIGERFFTPFFDKLMGQTYVREMIIAGHSANEIRERWQPDVDRFLLARAPYLLYPE